MATKKLGKYERESALVNEILSKETITSLDRKKLLAILQVPFHDSGKIEGIQSIDSSAHNCSFCEKMIEAGKENPDLICNYCYDRKQETRWLAVKNRHGLQLKILSSVLFEIDELALLPIYTDKVRFDSSGDIENVIQARNYIRIARAHETTTFTLWTKNLVALKQAIDIEGKPENLIVIYSDPIIDNTKNHGTIFKSFPWIDNIFMVARPEKIDSFIASGMNECNGKKCIDCGYKCYVRNAWKNHTVIVEKLR